MRRSSIACVIAGASVVALATRAHAQPVAPDRLIPELTLTPPPVVPPPPRAKPTPSPPAVPSPTGESSGSSGSVSAERATAERVCGAREPGCDWMALVGSLERASLRRVVAAHGYTIDPAPWGKIIGKIRIHNEDVFAEKTRVLRFFNNFHYTTRARTIAQELVIQEGEVWDQPRVEETARRLRDPIWTSVVAILPLASPEPGKVDLLVVTRDVWSLRLNTQYAFYADGESRKLTKLNISLSENNFLGRRTVLAAAMAMDQAVISTGPLLIDKNLFGKRLDLRLRGEALFNRDALLDYGKLVREGSASTISLSKPLWALASTWGVGGSFSHRFEIERAFRGTDLRTYDNPDTDEMEAIPFVYRLKVISANVNATRQWGTRFKHQISVGYSATSQRPSPHGFEFGDVARAAFIRDVLPRSEVTSGPYVEYSGFRPTYKTLRNIQTYDLGEDARFGPDYSLVLGGSAESLGASANFLRASASAGWTHRLCRDGFLRGTIGAAFRYQPSATDSPRFLDDLIDNTAFVRLRIASPTYFNAGRIVAEAALATRWNDTQNRFYTIGQDTGLRGFLINEFQGQRVFGTQVEARSVPFALWVFRVGAVAFYEVGGAASSLGDLELFQDVGVGLRSLIPQTSRDLLRFDFAVPLDGPAAGTLRFIAGFESAF